MATPIIDSGQCQVYVTNSYDTTGSLTRSKLKPATPEEMYAAFYDVAQGQWNEMSRYLVNQFEMEMCGVRRYSMFDWIMSSVKGGKALVNVRKVNRGPSLIEPFILGEQESVVNDEDWTISSGWRTGAGGTNAPYSESGSLYTASVTGPLSSLTGGDRVIRVAAKYGITPDAQYFLTDHKVIILGRSGGGTVKFGTWRIVSAAAENASPPTYVDVLLDAETPDSAAAHFDAGPTSGLVRLMPNSIHDVEAWCRNRINTINIKEVPFWFQTMRRARKTSSEYEKVRSALLRDCNNPWFKKFHDLTDAQRNAQDELKWKREFVNAFLFQDALNANQTIALWKDLPQIATVAGSVLDPGTSGLFMGFRANMIGVIPQLRACGQVQDYQNAPLNIKDWIEDKIYNVFRARDTAGRPSRSLDVYTDNDTAQQAEAAMIAWYTDRYGDIQRIEIKEGEEYGYSWRSFKIPTKPHNVTINFIVNEAFDDLINGLGTSLASAGRFLMALDLGQGGSIYPVMIASNRKVHTLGELQNLAKVDTTYACVMENPTENIQLMSETVSAVVECPLRSHVAHGFSHIEYVA